MTYHNPVIPGFHPDPSVCRVGDKYYLVTSSFEYFPGVPIFESLDLVNWRQIGHCLTRNSQLPLEGAGSSKGIFAPTLRFHQDWFYMVTTNVSAGGNFLVKAQQPEGPWSEPIWLDQVGIDPSLLFDDDGRVYLTTSDGANGAILQSELNPQTGERLSDVRLIWTGTGGAYPEGPHLYRMAESYYLMISEGGTEYGHMITIARSLNPYGPYEPCPHNPILTHRSLFSEIHATGHGDLVQTAEGDWWMVFLAIRPILYPHRHHLGRETFLAPVRWNQEGWPIVGHDGQVALEMEAGRLPLQPDAKTSAPEGFTGDKLAPHWNFLRNPDPENYSLTKRPGWLTLQGSVYTLNDLASPVFVGRRQQHFDCQARTLLEFAPVQDGEEAGLTVIMNERFHYELALTRREGRQFIILRRRLGTLTAVEFAQPYDHSTVELRVDADRRMYRFFFRTAEGEYQLAGSGETSLLSKEVAGGFTGVFFGLYATGNGRECTATAYFNWLAYEIKED